MFRVIDFGNGPIVRSKYRSKAEKFARKLVRKQKERAETEQIISSTVEVDNFDDDEDDMMIFQVNEHEISTIRSVLSIFSCVRIAFQNRNKL